ncbi:MAG: YiiG family protein [Polyangiaceae bacterium]
MNSDHPSAGVARPRWARLRALTAVLSLSVLSLVTAPGCKVIENIQKSMDKAASSSKSGPLGATTNQTAQNFDPDDPDAPLADKLNNPIECINKTSPAILRSRARYLSWVDEKTGPKGTERIVYGLYEVPESLVGMCKTAIKKMGENNTPTPDLDKLLATYESKLDALVPTAKTANLYYQHEDYKDDKFAKAKELHPTLVKAFAEFAEADKALRAEVTKLKAGMDQRELDRIEKQSGKNLSWNEKKLNMLAKVLVELADEDLDKLQLDKFEAALKDVETQYLATDKYATEHADETSKVMMFSLYLNAAKDYVKAAKDLMRRKRDKTPFSEGDLIMINGGNPQMIEGHPAHVIDKYNGLIDEANSLRF